MNPIHFLPSPRHLNFGFFRRAAHCLLLGAGAVLPLCAVAAPTEVRLAPEPAQEISPLLFGQFLERTKNRPGDSENSHRERGPESAYLPGTTRWQPGVVEALAELNAPIIRFPGGSMLGSLYDWTVMLDHSPFRAEAGRPEGYRFGWHEFFALCRELEAEPLVGVNFRAAVWGARPGELPDSPEALAAGMVAYCNLPLGADLPEGMPDWPAYRAENGHPEPFGVNYFQIGNEWVGWLQATDSVFEQLGKEPLADDEALARHTAARLLDVIGAMRAIDPDIKIVIDAVLWQDPRMPTWIGGVLADPEVQQAADFATIHLYRPWGVDSFTKDGEPVEGDQLSPEDIWYATVGAPNIDEAGFSTIRDPAWNLAREHGWPVVMTEWNWNGWGVERQGSTLWPRALGVAGFLHAMLRESGHIHLATQSMMLGNHWMIAGVRVDPSAATPPFVLPSGRMTGFYAEHSGERFVPLEIEGAPVRGQPVSMGSLQAAERLSLLDVIATEDDDRLFLHIINRDKDRAHTLRIDLAGRSVAPAARLHRMIGTDWQPLSQYFVHPGSFEESHQDIRLDPADPLTIEVPAASVSILELEIPPTTKPKTGD